ncbi:hypothetical protein EON66_03415 [archaeon]|nr:MAG: hypothetical protein EON66_03415 [archaeon]
MTRSSHRFGAASASDHQTFPARASPRLRGFPSRAPRATHIRTTVHKYERKLVHTLTHLPRAMTEVTHAHVPRAYARSVCDQTLVGIRYYLRHEPHPVVETRVPGGWKSHVAVFVQRAHVLQLKSVSFSLVREGSAESVSSTATVVPDELEDMDMADTPAGYVCMAVRDLCKRIRWTSAGSSLPKEPLVLHVDLQFDEPWECVHVECEPTYYRTNIVKGTSLTLLSRVSAADFGDVPVSAWLSPGFGTAATLARLQHFSQTNIALHTALLKEHATRMVLEAAVEGVKAEGMPRRLAIRAVANAGAGRVLTSAAAEAAFALPQDVPLAHVARTNAAQYGLRDAGIKEGEGDVERPCDSKVLLQPHVLPSFFTGMHAAWNDDADFQPRMPCGSPPVDDSAELQRAGSQEWRTSDVSLTCAMAADEPTDLLRTQPLSRFFDSLDAANSGDKCAPGSEAVTSERDFGMYAVDAPDTAAEQCRLLVSRWPAELTPILEQPDECGCIGMPHTCGWFAA